jgi:hypothetical protein
MIPKNVLSATCKFQGISMYKWCDFLQKYSILISDSMNIEDVLPAFIFEEDMNKP